MTGIRAPEMRAFPFKAITAAHVPRIYFAAIVNGAVPSAVSDRSSTPGLKKKVLGQEIPGLIFKSFISFESIIANVRALLPLQLIPQSRVLVKLLVAELVKNVHKYYGTRRIIVIFPRVHHWTISYFLLL